MTDNTDNPRRQRGKNEVSLLVDEIKQQGMIAVPEQEAEADATGRVDATVDRYFGTRGDWKRKQAEYIESRVDAAKEKRAQETEASEAPLALTEEQIRALTPSQRNKLVDDTIAIQGENDELTYRESEPTFAEYTAEMDAWEAEEDEDDEESWGAA